MRISFKRPVIHQGHVTENIPPHKTLREFEWTVLYQFGIQSSVGSIINVLKKQTIHGWLYFRTKFIGLHDHVVRILCM